MATDKNEHISVLETNIDELCTLYDKSNKKVVRDKLSKVLKQLSYNNEVDFKKIFNRIIDSVGIEAFFDIVNYNSFLNIFSSKLFVVYIYFECILNANNSSIAIDRIVNNEELFKGLVSVSRTISPCFHKLSNESIIKLVTKMSDTGHLCSNDIIDKNNSELHLQILKSLTNPKTVCWVLDICSKETIEEYLTTLNVAEFLNSDCVSIIISKGVKIPEQVLNSKKFIGFIKKDNLIDFREVVNNLVEKTGYFQLENDVVKYYESLLSTYNSSLGIFSEYEPLLEYDFNLHNDNDMYLMSFDLDNLDIDNTEELKQRLQKVTSQKIGEMVIDALFKDNKYNVEINIIELLRYQISIGQNIIPIDRIEFYNKILKFDDLSSEEKIAIFNKYKNVNVSQLFYTDLRTVKNDSYTKVNESLYKLNSKVADNELSSKYNVPVYYFSGEPFYFFVRALDVPFDFNVKNPRGCYSLIGSDNYSTYEGKYVYGFNSINIDDVIHVFENDSFSNAYTKDKTSSINRVMTPSEIVLAPSFSEIQLKNDKDLLPIIKPDYLLVFDEVLPFHIEEANRLNIPIYLVDRKLYKGNIDEAVSLSTDSYIKDSRDLFLKR